MRQPDVTPTQRKGLWTTLAMTAVAGAGTLALTLPVAFPVNTAYADPVPPPPPGTTSPAPAPVDPNAAPPPVDPNAAPPPVDPNAPPPPLDPNAPPPPAADPNAPPPPPADPNRVNVAAGGFSYDPPPGWAVGDASKISYGQALLTKAPATQGGQAPTDTSILMGRLDLKLFAGAEPDNSKAAIRLASDMGEFYMPFPGTRINQETVTLDANGIPGAASYYEVKFTDTNKPNGQIWAAALGSTTPRQGSQPAQNNRWFVVWLGTANNPVDKAAAKTLAQSIRPYTPPPPPEAPPPGAPGAPPAPGQPAPVGVPVPVAPNPEMMPPS
jgi:Fibronectin-attachment protein (FAP)